MSALGQKQTSAHVRIMSALPPESGHNEALRVEWVSQKRSRQLAWLAPCVLRRQRKSIEKSTGA
jgi:hypothetical protein